jgi:hypothetical protein
MDSTVPNLKNAIPDRNLPYCAIQDMWLFGNEADQAEPRPNQAQNWPVHGLPPPSRNLDGPTIKV